MSLKAFHVVFLIAAISLCLAIGVWGVRDYQVRGVGSSLGMAICCFAAAGVLGPYGVWFLRKLRNVSYL